MENNALRDTLYMDFLSRIKDTIHSKKLYNVVTIYVQGWVCGEAKTSGKGLLYFLRRDYMEILQKDKWAYAPML